MKRAIRTPGTHQIIEAQHGLITRQQALHAGLSKSMIARRLGSGTWERLGAAVYRLVGTRRGWEQRLLAACLAGNAIASHRSAAALWSLAGSTRSVVEITTRRHHRTKNPEVSCHESHTLFAQDVTELDNIPVTMPTRTIIDLAVVLPEDDVEIALDDALRRSLTSLPRIRTMLDVLGPHRPGRARMDLVLDRRPEGDAVPESYLETRFAQVVRKAGLPEPERQVRVESRNRIAYLDFAYREARVAIEVDGYEGHGGRSAWQAGLERMNRIGEVGWQVLHFSSTDIERRPDRVAEQVLTALNRQAA
ncbi:MAG: DUF559 domain-containing protein [Acidimicrobiia bacterium]